MTHPFRQLAKRTSFLLFFARVQFDSVAELTFYVSPSGKDQWSGHRANPTPDRRDGPFASVSAAIRAARAGKENAARRREAVSILLRAGTYELTEPIALLAVDSGFSEQRPFTIANYPNEHPILSGGRRITGWGRLHGRSDI